MCGTYSTLVKDTDPQDDPEAPAGLNASTWMKRLLLHLAQQAARDARHISRWQETTVHSLRKRMKKLQALLLLARPVLGEPDYEALRTRVRSLKNLVGTARDADVMAKLQEKFGSSVWARHTSPLPRSTIARLTAQADHLVRLVRETDFTGLDWDMVATAHALTYQKGRKAWQHAQENPEPETLHKWRTQVKRLHYQATALHPWIETEKELQRSRKLGSLLGRCHDLDVFADMVKAEKLKAPSGWKQDLRERRKDLMPRIFRRAAKVFSRRSRKIKQRSRHSLPSLSPASA